MSDRPNLTVNYARGWKAGPPLPPGPPARGRPVAVRDVVIEVGGIGSDGGPVARRIVVDRAGEPKALRGLPDELRSVARAYAGLLERVEAGGVGGAPLSGPIDGGTRSEPALAVLGERQLLARIRNRVGQGRVRMGWHGRTIAVQTIVEGVVAGSSLARVLAAADIEPNHRRITKAASALADALGRVANGFPRMRA